jgi:hypothetical protein
MIEGVGFSVQDDVQSVRGLGTGMLEGQSVRVYSYTVHGTPVTVYVGANALPVQSVINDKNGTTTIRYSQYDAPISIQAP